MSVWVVVGGQYGSEGKGKIAAYITLEEKIDICVRCGGPNSGHCFVDEAGDYRALRQIPTGYVRPETRLLIPPGGLVDLEVLKHEIDSLRLGPERVGIDYRTMVIEERDRQAERDLNLRHRLSSTLCGVGSAVSRKVLRGDDVLLTAGAAEKITWLHPYLVDAPAEINQGIDTGKKVLVEATQGFGLSLYHADCYPKTTSRDTSAAGCISECGISPLAVTEVVMVLRTFPIRVAGEQAGPLREEISWEILAKECGATTRIEEFTTVTGKLRRIGRFDWQDAARAVKINRPNRLAVNFADYIDIANRSVTTWKDLTQSAKEFVARLESITGVPVQYVGTGPSLAENVTKHASVPELDTSSRIASAEQRTTYVE